MSRAILHEWVFPQEPEEVWTCLTAQEILSEWLMPNDFLAEVGHRFQFKTRSRFNLGFDGNIYCEVLEIIPLQKLVYTWEGGPAPGNITLHSVVTWTLEPRDGGTLLRLEHNGFKGLRNVLAYLVMKKGWQLIVGKRLFNAIQLH